MKKINKIIIATFTILIANVIVAQNKIAQLDGINYQAVAIDDETAQIVGKDIVNKPLYEKEIAVRFTINDGPIGTVTYYQEEHTTTTDKYGLFSLTIGHGTLTGSGDYDSLLTIPWINGDQFLMVEISKNNDGNFRTVSHEKFMAVPFAFYSDDIADNSISTYKVINEALLAEDINTGAVETSEILDSTILNEDIADGSVDSRTILNETILAEDINTGAVETSEILDSTILNEDIADGSVDSRTILNETILAEDINTGAVETSEILDSTILNEDIANGSVDSRTILNGTIINEDIANATIDLTSKVTNVLPVDNGGTGLASIAADNILVGNGTSVMDAIAVTDSVMLFSNKGGPVLYKLQAGLRTSITVDAATKTVTISADQQAGGGPAVVQFTVNTNISPGTSIIVPISYTGVIPGDIILSTANFDLQGVTMTSYVKNAGAVSLVFFNGTGSTLPLVGGIKIANFGQ